MVKSRSDLLLTLIVFQKAFLGLLSIVLSAGILSLVNQDLAAFAQELGRIFYLEADNQFTLKVVDTLTNTKASTLIGVSLIGFSYGGLNLTEAYGLWRRYRWAEYLTVVATSLFIPIEIYEVLKNVSVLRVGTLVINVLIVVFLIKHKELFPRRMGEGSS